MQEGNMKFVLFVLPPIANYKEEFAFCVVCFVDRGLLITNQ